MKIISWNLNHRINEKPIPEEVYFFFKLYSPDIIFINEYVDGISRDKFKTELASLGYKNQLLSLKAERQNQIIAVSKYEMVQGEIIAPDLTIAAQTNFLHAAFPQVNIEIVGIRAPAYKAASERKLYWEQVARIISSTDGRNILFIGDVNYNPFSGVSAHAPKIQFNLNNSFIIPNPEGEWSFISIDGKNKTRIDHAIISESIKTSNVKYLTNYEGIVLAGPKGSNAITDHAVLSLEVEIENT